MAKLLREREREQNKQTKKKERKKKQMTNFLSETDRVIDKLSQA